jgi:hypothetical protein
LCPGDGLDSAAAGIISALLIPSAIGLILWASRYQIKCFCYPRLIIFNQLIFAILRPRFRQIYALREWFVHQE